jgi:hypothetical protein
VLDEAVARSVAQSSPRLSTQSSPQLDVPGAPDHHLGERI